MIRCGGDGGFSSTKSRIGFFSSFFFWICDRPFPHAPNEMPTGEIGSKLQGPLLLSDDHRGFINRGNVQRNEKKKNLTSVYSPGSSISTLSANREDGRSLVRDRVCSCSPLRVCLTVGCVAVNVGAGPLAKVNTNSGLCYTPTCILWATSTQSLPSFPPSACHDER